MYNLIRQTHTQSPTRNSEIVFDSMSVKKVGGSVPSNFQDGLHQLHAA